MCFVIKFLVFPFLAFLVLVFVLFFYALFSSICYFIFEFLVLRFRLKFSVVFYFRVLCASFSSYGCLQFVFEFILPVLCASFTVLGACILFLLSSSVLDTTSIKHAN